MVFFTVIFFQICIVHYYFLYYFFHITLAIKSIIKKTSPNCALIQVCGDGICEEEELCSTCPADCGECPMTSQTKLAIGLTLSLLCLCFTLTTVVRTTAPKPTNAWITLMLSLKSNPLGGLVAEVPETEAAVGRELDHRLCLH